MRPLKEGGLAIMGLHWGVNLGLEELRTKVRLGGTSRAHIKEAYSMGYVGYVGYAGNRGVCMYV